MSCKDHRQELSSPTLGEVTIACDRQMKALLTQQEEMFEHHYKYAKVNMVYGSETDIFKWLGNDSIKTIAAFRPLTEGEHRYFNSIQIHPREFPFATGSLALLAHKDAPDSALIYESFIGLCKGDSSVASSFTTVVVEDAASGIARILLDKTGQDRFSDRVFTLPDKETIFQYLQSRKEAIAVVDWADYSDSDDRLRQQELENVKILGLTRPKDSLQMGFLRPDQYNLQDHKYPLTRKLYFISVSGRSDLGLGFASFVSGEIGQRILLKAGLLPEYQAERWIELKSEGFQVVE